MPRRADNAKGRRAGVPKARLTKKENFAEANAESGSPKQSPKLSSALQVSPKKQAIDRQRKDQGVYVPRRWPDAKSAFAEELFDMCLKNLEEKAKARSAKSTKPPLAMPKEKKSASDAKLVEIIGMTDDGSEEVIYGYYRLQGEKVVSSPRPGYELGMSRLLKHRNFVDGGRRRVSAVSSPQEWLDSCPSNFDGVRVRARIIE